MSRSLIIVLVSITGGLVALQGAFNAQLGKLLSHPLQAAIVSFVVGLLGLIAAAFALRTGLPFPKAIGAVPPHLLIGGLFGAMFVTGTVFFIPHVGVATVLIASVAGQILVSMVLDHYGLFGVPQQPVGLARAAGGFLVVAGLYLVSLGRS